MGFEPNNKENCHNMDNQKVSEMYHFTFKLSQLHFFQTKEKGVLWGRDRHKA